MYNNTFNNLNLSFALVYIKPVSCDQLEKDLVFFLRVIFGPQCLQMFIYKSFPIGDE